MGRVPPHDAIAEEESRSDIGRAQGGGEEGAPRRRGPIPARCRRRRRSGSGRVYLGAAGLLASRAGEERCGRRCREAGQAFEVGLEDYRRHGGGERGEHRYHRGNTAHGVQKHDPRNRNALARARRGFDTDAAGTGSLRGFSAEAGRSLGEGSGRERDGAENYENAHRNNARWEELGLGRARAVPRVLDDDGAQGGRGGESAKVVRKESRKSLRNLAIFGYYDMF